MPGGPGSTTTTASKAAPIGWTTRLPRAKPIVAATGASTVPSAAPAARSVASLVDPAGVFSIHVARCERVEGRDGWRPEVLATARRDDLGERMHELRHRARDRELVVAVGPTDERIAVVADPHGVTVVAPVRLDELVLALDVGHVGDEVDAAVGTVVGRAVGKRGTVGHPPPDDALARGECISCAETRTWVRASDVRAERAVDSFGVVAVVERVDACRIEAHRRVGMMRRERER